MKRVLAAGFFLSIAGCGQNRFELGPPLPGPPLTGSVVAVKQGIEVQWSRVDAAESYTVYWGTDRDAVGSGESADFLADAHAPQLVDGLEEGQRYYVSVAAVIDGGPAISAVLPAEPLLDQPSEPERGLVVDAGFVISVRLGKSSSLAFASFSDPFAGGTQSCNVEWNDGDADLPTAPCSLNDGHEWKEAGRFQPVLTVENTLTGRIGAAFTTAYVR